MIEGLEARQHVSQVAEALRGLHVSPCVFMSGEALKLELELTSVG